VLVQLAVDRSPTLRRRELASRLRDLRRQAGLTVEDVATQLLCSQAKISRIETGARPANLRDVRDLCAIYGVEETQREQLMTLAREARQQGWWQRFDDLAIESLIGLETEAARISTYQSSVIPWAFQTKDYAYAVIKGALPRIANRILEERVSARLIRQELLTREDPPRLWALIDESALQRQVGSRKIMHEQLSRMIELADYPNIVMQVVPYEAGAHPGLDSTFTLLEFDDPSQRPVVYTESMAGSFYLERPVDIDRHREALEYLRACSLSPASSVSLIERINQLSGLQAD
jgi:transcriptional regulator with XRE-family HTH domain